MNADAHQFAIQRIISAGQTGADRAALDFAMKDGIPHGGWCPKGRLAEDRHLDMPYDLILSSMFTSPQAS